MKTANWSRAEALSLMENWLTAHSGKINGIIGQNDEMALGAIEAVKAKSVTAMTLEVRPSNTAALALYHKFGFRSVGRRPHYYQDNGEDAEIMWNTKL